MVRVDSPIDSPVLAIVGGGQLARMMEQAAVSLAVPVSLLAEGPDVSAAQVNPTTTVGDYRDLETLRTVASGCAVVTFDHEHVPPEHLRALDAEGHACRPGPHALLYAQDKREMREALTRLGVPCPRWAPVADAAELERFAAAGDGFPVVVKTTRGGYDGKGVWVVDGPEAAADAFATGVPLIAEELVDFRRELSALVARSASGQVAAYPVVESRQENGVCREVIAPAPGLPAERAAEAEMLAMKVAAELDVVGILAVELFETVDGRLLVNELAMRPHNTGHWTMDGAVTGQFENHLRAVLDLPLGSPRARAPYTVMVNILGGEVGRLYDGYPHVMARDPDLKVHLYGKAVKPGRKVGHVTAYGDDVDALLERARHAAAWFEGRRDDEIEDEAQEAARD
ncbi:5-(carboxyamino)imidazole ribonucleotide synthase [Mumia zhuanghuii]|uniref:N5-carboxyaminoimidazole ribonucleotide synthase n=1 Tax=Mumia zhuanghuii TaxID=2585211 RepID=A0A5C4MD10_9ACTN|nr:5-(carboxyamino)imidazole ribonucleotide synthase [Mumia zhuanghuii]TNC31217.1 5-(carboxyamino)imidazole ribonucleotide synthase [Mumia zhuanghuii]TNC44922.1 5-(carboxyamino)imidazole ribonucleotide synthase [Mumia zhuanghuii]